MTGKPVNSPCPLTEAGNRAEELVAVRIEDPELCPYTARVSVCEDRAEPDC